MSNKHFPQCVESSSQWICGHKDQVLINNIEIMIFDSVKQWPCLRTRFNLCWVKDILSSYWVVDLCVRTIMFRVCHASFVTRSIIMKFVTFALWLRGWDLRNTTAPVFSLEGHQYAVRRVKVRCIVLFISCSQSNTVITDI